MGMVRLVRSTAVRGRNIVQVCYFAPDALRRELRKIILEELNAVLAA